jgi:hypothetical protein
VKRLLLLLLAVAGCQTTTLGPPAKILGINDMVRVGQYLVVPSTERDELRVLNMVTATVDVRQYVPAPNPLAPLAIPVLPRPTLLAVDTAYADYNGVAQGTEITGPYIYASSAGAPDISVVNVGIGQPSVDGGSTAPDAVEQFVELRRLLTSAPVTAMTATTIPPEHTLIFATFDGTIATVWEAAMPPPAALLGDTNIENTFTVDFTLPPDEVIVSMVAMPGNRLAVATRVNAGSGGRTFIYDRMAKTVTVTLQFPGPVRTVQISAGADLGYGPNHIAPGDRVFGILDEEVCGNAAVCGGILAVNSVNLDGLGPAGQISIDQPGFNALMLPPPNTATPQQAQMLPLRFGNTLITALALQPQGAMLVPASQTGTGIATEEALSVLGVASLANGGIVFINAGSLIVYDADDNSTGAEIPPAITAEVITDVEGNVVATSNGPIIDGGPQFPGGPGTAVGLTDGKARDENLHVVFNGLIPGLSSLTAAADLLPTTGGFETRAVPKDTVVGCLSDDGGIFGDDGGLLIAGTVKSVEDGGIRFTTNNTCPAGPFSIRAGPQLPFVVVGDVSGYMGRADAGDIFYFDGGYFFHPNGVFIPNAPQLALPFAFDTSDLTVGQQWTLTVNDNYKPTIATMDPTAANCGLPVNLPGQPVINPDLQHIFFAIPSANAIVDLNAVSAQRGTIESNMSCWR